MTSTTISEQLHREQPASGMDPISLEIQWQRLITVMDEVDNAIIRTSFSTIVGEARDFACILLDSTGQSLAQSTFSTPLFTVTLPTTTHHLLAEFPAETLVDGDALITNNPWFASGHLPDISIVSPVFHRGRLIALLGTVAHVSDIGGRLGYYDAADVFEEGLCIPPSKLYQGGVPNRDIFAIVRANVRVPDMVVGDLHAIVGAQHFGARRLREFLDDYGLEDLAALAAEIHDRSERAMRRAIGQIPDGVYEYQLVADGYRQPLHIRARVEIRGEEAFVDYAGSSEQFGVGAINAPYNNAFADTVYPFKCSLTPHVPNNSGLFRPIHMQAPEGSVLNARYPCAVKARSNTDVQVHSALYGALARPLGAQAQAGSGSFWGVVANGVDDTGRRFNNFLIPNGGKGALGDMDGLPTTAFPHNSSVTPVEIYENTAPLLMERKQLIPDSGGPGTYRGGLGQEIVVCSRSQRPVTITLRPDKLRFPPPGLAEGEPGGIGSFDLDGEPFDHHQPFRLAFGQKLRLRLPGGGGFGPPERRDPALVARDVREGYVTPGQARAVYRVAIDAATGQVELDATRRLRATQAEQAPHPAHLREDVHA